MLMVSVCMCLSVCLQPLSKRYAVRVVRSEAFDSSANKAETIEQFRLPEAREAEQRNERAQVRETVCTR